MGRYRTVVILGLVCAALVAVQVGAMVGTAYRARGAAVDALTGAEYDALIEYTGLEVYRLTLTDHASGLSLQLPPIAGRELTFNYEFVVEEWCGGQVWNYDNRAEDKTTGGRLFLLEGWRKYCLAGPANRFQGDLVGHYGQDFLLHFTQFP